MSVFIRIEYFSHLAGFSLIHTYFGILLLFQ